MEELEDPTEAVHEHLNEDAAEARERWTGWAALTAALLAALAAVATLLSGHHVNEAMMDRVKSVDQFSYYQSKGIEKQVILANNKLLKSLGKPPSEEDAQSLAKWDAKREESKAKGEEADKSSEAHFRHHVTLSYGVTMFQVAIAIAAISVLTRRRHFWIVAVLFGLIGVGFFVAGVLPTGG